MFMLLFIAIYTIVIDYLVQYKHKLGRVGGTVPKKDLKIHPDQLSQLKIV